MTDASHDSSEQQSGFSDETEDEEMMTDADDDFSEDSDDEEIFPYGEGVGEPDDFADELTPNDLFGLDPLDVLTLEELADYLKVSTAAANRMIKEQKLPGRNIGGQWRFLRDAVANWLRCLETPVQQQQKLREDFSASKPDNSSREPGRFNRGSQSEYSSESGRGYRSRQRFTEGGGGGQYGYQSGQYGSGGSGQYGGGGSGRPGRRPFRSSEGGQNAESVYGAEGGGGGAPEQGGGQQYGGYRGGERRFGGGPKRKNKRHVFENERGKRMDRRKQGPQPEGSE